MEGQLGQWGGVTIYAIYGLKSLIILKSQSEEEQQDIQEDGQVCSH
jgi:hypothetical protein